MTRIGFGEEGIRDPKVRVSSAQEARERDRDRGGERGRKGAESFEACFVSVLFIMMITMVI